MNRNTIMLTVLASTIAAGITLSPRGLVRAASQDAAPPQAVASKQTPAPAPAPTFKAKKLTRAEFDGLLSEPDKILILDVRRPDELETIGAFPAFLSIQARDVEQRLAFIPKGRTIITVSNHANRAGRAADLLTSRGFTVAGAIGAQDYEAEGGTLVKVTKPSGSERSGR
jgi:rhodanese-related sulfurtransferase